MKFPEFVKEMESDLKAFEAWWMAKHREEPDHFPLELDAGDWFDQLLTYLGTDRK